MKMLGDSSEELEDLLVGGRAVVPGIISSSVSVSDSDADSDSGCGLDSGSCSDSGSGCAGTAVVCSTDMLWLPLSGGATVGVLISTETPSSDDEEEDDGDSIEVTTSAGADVVTTIISTSSEALDGDTVVSGGVTGLTVGGAIVDVVVVLRGGDCVAGAV